MLFAINRASFFGLQFSRRHNFFCQSHTLLGRIAAQSFLAAFAGHSRFPGGLFAELGDPRSSSDRLCARVLSAASRTDCSLDIADFTIEPSQTSRLLQFRQCGVRSCCAWPIRARWFFSNRETFGQTNLPRASRARSENSEIEKLPASKPDSQDRLQSRPPTAPSAMIKQVTLVLETRIKTV